MSKILLISRTPVLSADLKQQFTLSQNWETVDEYAAETVFDAVVVDEDAAAARELRAQLLQTPLFLLWPAETEPVSEQGVTVIRKPFRLEYLLEALQAGINTAPAAEATLALNGCLLDLAAKEIHYADGNRIKLTERETAILKYLYKAGAKIVGKAELLAEVWGYNPEATTHTVETHIYRLRQKIESDAAAGQVILTEENGYRLNLG